MKIAVNFENLPSDGGAYHENILLSDVFKSFENTEFEIVYIVSNKKIKEILENRGLKTIFFKKNVIFRIQNFFYKFLILKFFLNKLKIKNIFEKFIKKNKIDLIIFNNPSEMSLHAYNLMYVIVFYELQHLKYNFFPEYKSYHDFDMREIIIKNFLKKAFKVIACVQKDKNLLEKYYNANKDKIIIQSFVSRLPLIYEKNKTQKNYDEHFKNLKLIENKKILFYPAQFWPHKNHKYLIDAMDALVNDHKINDYHFVLCGYDKFNHLSFLKELIKKKNLDEYFSFFDYLKDEEIISIYKNCHALIMPTFVGHYSLPLLESFYFKLPVLFTKDLLDEELKKFVYEIDTTNKNSLFKKLNYIKENKDEVDLNLKEAFNYYNKVCSIKKIEDTYKNIFKEVLYYQGLWRR